jgi:hypothetical protein
MNRKQRETLAATLGRIASQAGASVAISPDGRDTRVECTFPRVSVSFGVGGTLAPGILAHWFNASADLAPGAWFDSVNPCHHRKATLWGADDVEFGARFYRACRAVADGRAFA